MTVSDDNRATLRIPLCVIRKNYLPNQSENKLKKKSIRFTILLVLAKNYRGITLTSIAAKNYNFLLLNRTQQKTLKPVSFVVVFPKRLTPYTRVEWKKMLLAYGIPSKAVSAVMMLYKKKKSLVRSPDGDTDLFDIEVGVLQGDILAPFLFIITFDYQLCSEDDS